jgi:hypothetical protein
LYIRLNHRPEIPACKNLFSINGQNFCISSRYKSDKNQYLKI